MGILGLRRPRWAMLMLLMMMPSRVPAATVQAAAGTRWWGVIVGVSQYEHLQGFDLDGPSQDVPLVLNWLRRQSVPRRQLTVLADHVAGADGLPTRSAILEALTHLSAQAQRGDVAFLYLAGHGSQQPQGGSEWSKSDGMQEIFLPRDVGQWDGRGGEVQGALSGTDLGRAIEALRAKGVFVWLVVDSCHSATIARAARVPHLTLRAVPPGALQVPARDPGPGPGDTHLVQIKAHDLPGGYVAFYAAQTTEAAPEMPLPAGELNNAVHGLFSYALLKALGAGTSRSYRDLAHRILAYYASLYPATTPEFEGALDGVLGSPDAPLQAPGMWPVVHDAEDFRIEAGRLNGVTPGTLLALYAPLKPGAPMGLLEVQQASLSEGSAHAVHTPATLKAWKIPADRTSEMASGTAQVLQSSVDLTVRIAQPTVCAQRDTARAGCGDVTTPDAPGARARARTLLMQRDLLPLGATLTENAGSADLFLQVRGQRLYLLRASSTPLSQAAFIDLDSAEAGASLADALRRAVRAVALVRLSREFPENQPQLAAALQVRAPDGHWQSGPPGAVPFGSELSLRLQNIAPNDIDVTVLSVTDNWAITPVYPVDQESNLLRRGSAPLAVSGWARSHGETALVFIVEDNRSGRPHDLGYLAQPGVARAQAGDGLGALLERAGFSPAGQRGGLPADARQAASMRVLPYFVIDSR